MSLQDLDINEVLYGKNVQINRKRWKRVSFRN